uniref:Uncharacterized protein n=1 Tax=Timema poppense TaxID=170557 RepID=A0A7R9DSF6_TIMPO|nr:unnamed protein product [Timema poppensis]
MIGDWSRTSQRARRRDLPSSAGPRVQERAVTSHQALTNPTYLQLLYLVCDCLEHGDPERIRHELWPLCCCFRHHSGDLHRSSVPINSSS